MRIASSVVPWHFLFQVLGALWSTGLGAFRFPIFGGADPRGLVRELRIRPSCDIKAGVEVILANSWLLNTATPPSATPATLAETL